MKFLAVALFAFILFGVPRAQVAAQYPSPTSSATCQCLGNGNCSGTGCSTGNVLACGVQCPPGYRNVEMWCGPQYCGGKCIYEQSCNTGFCQGLGCNTVQGSFLCGDGGCNSCQRLTNITVCSGSNCQYWCSNDETCGVGCGGSGTPNTPTPGGGGGPTSPPGGPTNTPPPPGSTNTPVPTNTTVPTNTPVPVGTIRARAVVVDAADTSCAAVKGVPTTAGEIDGTTIEFTPSSASQPAPRTQTGAAYVTFANVVTGSYIIDPAVPSADWIHAKNCWTNQTTGATGETLSAILGANQTLRWDIGYTLGSSWVQTGGGDVYASGSVRSFLPGVTPRVFNTDGVGGYPGVVTYGVAYDFDSDPFSTGSTLVSSQNWRVNESRATVDYYDYFYRKYHSPTTVTTDPAFSNPLAVTKPTSAETPHYVVGPITTNGNWTVGNNESIVILVNGNLTIGGNITITGNGFIAFIVNGTIMVADTVGTTSADTSPAIEGVYIATKADHTGSFNTGSSIAAGTARLVGRGMFIADQFSLDRNLEGFGVGNTGASAELFTYNPQLLLTMPDAMKELTVTWQEVAP